MARCPTWSGRKLPLYFGLLLFAAGSIGCALAPDIHSLIVLRFIQGLGACAGMVVPRAIVRDLHTGNDAARLMSLLMLVFSVSPILAPPTGISWGWCSSAPSASPVFSPTWRIPPLR